MKRNFKMVWIVWIFLWTICQVEDNELDPECTVSCNCCKHNTCTYRFAWPNVCTQGCIDGHRGPRCYELCAYNCSSCPEITDQCEKCYDGFYLGQHKDCKVCPATCTKCISERFCTSCKYGYFDKDGSSTCAYSLCLGNCKCSNNTCVDCINGFFDTTTSCSKNCPSNCVTCTSINSCNECKDGYYNGHEFDDSVSLKLNNCTYECMEQCSKCMSYYNCSQCIMGKYGKTCKNDCSKGCKDGTCNVESGKCTCSSSFIGDTCTECRSGNYGTYCDKTCPAYCKNNKCDKSSGDCSDGCISSTVVGKTCNSCILGMHGEQCTETCPSNCKNKACDRFTSICSVGCEGNFFGNFCDICKRGKYGAFCDFNCPDKCVSSLCGKKKGNCIDCMGNFAGDKCNVCRPGYYGLICNDTCSFQCYNESCDVDSGICDYGCKSHYSGDKCCAYSDNCMKCTSDKDCDTCKSGYYGNFCQIQCPASCFDSCDIKTGVCGDCKRSKFGQFCNNTCSKHCKSNCASNDGACIFGCEDGFFGLTCDKTCSSICIDRVCKQESGICLKGCISSYNGPICAVNFGKTQEVSEHNSSTTTIAVLATLLAVTSTALCILMLKKILTKIRFNVRYTKDTSQQVHFDNALVGTQNSQNADVTIVSNLDVNYETLERNQSEPEHTYDAANLNTTESTDNDGNTQYMNL